MGDGCLDGVHFSNNGLGLSSGSLYCHTPMPGPGTSGPSLPVLGSCPPAYTFAWCSNSAAWGVLAGLAGFWSLTSSDLAC